METPSDAIVPLGIGNGDLITQLVRQVKPDPPKIYPLINREYEKLDWKSPFNYPNMIRIRTLSDGSCFFHAIAKAYYLPYKTGFLDGKPLNQQQFIRDLRKDLALKLGEKIPGSNKRYYDLLSRGELSKQAKDMPQWSLEYMQTELVSNGPVDNLYNEFISDMLNKDIYLLDLVTKDVYITGNDNDILYKKRDSIVLLTLPGHYELVGLITNRGIQTLFPYDHEFIQQIRQRTKEKIAIGSNKNNKS